MASITNISGIDGIYFNKTENNMVDINNPILSLKNNTSLTLYIDKNKVIEKKLNIDSLIIKNIINDTEEVLATSFYSVSFSTNYIIINFNNFVYNKNKSYNLNFYFSKINSAIFTKFNTNIDPYTGIDIGLPLTLNIIPIVDSSSLNLIKKGYIANNIFVDVNTNFQLPGGIFSNIDGNGNDAYYIFRILNVNTTEISRQDLFKRDITGSSAVNITNEVEFTICNGGEFNIVPDIIKSILITDWDKYKNLTKYSSICYVIVKMAKGEIPLSLISDSEELFDGDYNLIFNFGIIKEFSQGVNITDIVKLTANFRVWNTPSINPSNRIIYKGFDNILMQFETAIINYDMYDYTPQIVQFWERSTDNINWTTIENANLTFLSLPKDTLDIGKFYYRSGAYFRRTEQQDNTEIIIRESNILYSPVFEANIELPKIVGTPDKIKIHNNIEYFYGTNGIVITYSFSETDILKPALDNFKFGISACSHSDFTISDVSKNGTMYSYTLTLNQPLRENITDITTSLGVYTIENGKQIFYGDPIITNTTNLLVKPVEIIDINILSKHGVFITKSDSDFLLTPNVDLYINISNCLSEDTIDITNLIINLTFNNEVIQLNTDNYLIEKTFANNIVKLNIIINSLPYNPFSEDINKSKIYTISVNDIRYDSIVLDEITIANAFELFDQPTILINTYTGEFDNNIQVVCESTDTERNYTLYITKSNSFGFTIQPVPAYTIGDKITWELAGEELPTDNVDNLKKYYNANWFLDITNSYIEGLKVEDSESSSDASFEINYTKEIED